MPQTKIQGKFYPLKSSEWLDSISQLTHSELKILYYVRSLDPYNNGIDLSASQIARDLSTEKNKMHRSTVGRALKSLDRKGFINMELIKVRIKINPRGFLTNLEAESEPKPEAKNDVVATQPCCDYATDVVTTQQNVQPHNKECAHATESASTQQSKAETQSQLKVQVPKILKTYKDFKDSLSESEREKFFNFVRKKTENLERPINDLEAWLASKNAAKQNRWEIYFQKYQEEKISESKKSTRQGNKSGNYSPSEVERAIAEFKNRNKKREQELQQIKAQERLENAENVNSEEHRQREAEFNRLLDNLPEREVRKSPAQQRRENMAEIQRQQEAIERANREAAEERARQQQHLSIEERRAEIQRQIEEAERLHNTDKIDEIGEEGMENE